MGSDSDRYPRWWLFHQRWGRNAKLRPASTLLEISRFAIDGMVIEIEAVAVIR